MRDRHSFQSDLGSAGRVWGLRHRLIKGPCKKVELEAMQYVAKRTTVPVPKVFTVYPYHDARIHIEMEYIRGIDLETAWLDGHLSHDQKKKHLISEIAGYVNQLRSLEPPHKGFVGSASGEGGLDGRDCAQVFGQEVTDSHTRYYRSCFSHADLAPRNIIIENGKIAALIDWEYGGWYPEYWEYTKAHYVPVGMSDWYEGLKSAITRYDDELRAEQNPWTQCELPGMHF
ncbi:aminoglycoside phosphotransferase family protein [Aspergillus alliaceus]|uniref:aminoglycoside phosphotransferase family protein n=1 Tax=Petromyces alliaceus TaxID=209559 RepID=UPI0012A735F4|nr:kinase-like domain-containing protein [Aspergillus alliaceus]KAB8227632.1 kinase-like domain-containing protein [Aspergillus alliaceus]